MGKIYFLDVTNRDGVQAARLEMAKFQRTMLNYYLGQLGIHQSEFGFPFVWHESNYLEANLELRDMGVMGNLVLSGWCRAVAGDVKKALQHKNLSYLSLSIPTSEQMIRGKFQGRIDKDSVIASMVEAVHTALDGGVQAVTVNSEDASRTDIGYLIRFAEAAKQAGATRVRYCDTLGLESPDSIHRRIYAVASEVGVDIETHCHNDLGMAVANSISGARAAIDAGVDVYINTTVNGMGERAGNADLLSCILAVKFARGMAGRLEFGQEPNLSIAWKLAHYVADAFGLPLPINQVGVGDNAFAHESGIHADGMLKDRHNYELYDHELLGRAQWSYKPTGRIITTGEFGGMTGLRYVYERLGITFESDETALQTLNLVQAANAHNHMQLSPDELRFIVDYPVQVHRLLTVNIPDPSERNGVKRDVDMVVDRAVWEDKAPEEKEELAWAGITPKRESLHAWSPMK
jgi:isopropylmalate/homocitrate/citramalate synthase